MNMMKTMAWFVGLCLMPTLAFPADPVGVKIDRLEVDDNIYTPYYRVDTGRENERPGDQKWIRVGVNYTTEEGWFDELTIRYTAYASERNGPKPILFTTEVKYLNVGPGEHIGYAYLHPGYVDRYDLDGYNLDVSVELFASSPADSASAVKILAMKETTKHASAGWAKALSGDAPAGALLNRAETPFWLIDYDNRELIKPAL